MAQGLSKFACLVQELTPDQMKYVTFSQLWNYTIYFCQSQLGSASSAIVWSTIDETVSIGPSLCCVTDEPNGVKA